jgi:hypothetical protein
MNIDKARAIAHRWNEHVKAKQLAIALPGPAPKAKMSSGVVREGPDFDQGMAGSTEFASSSPCTDETHWWKAYAEHSAVDGRLHRAAVEDRAVRDTAARRALPTPGTELQSAPATVVHRTSAQGCA